MSVSLNALKSLDEHWAVSAIDANDLARAEELANQRLAQHALGRQIAFDFSDSLGDEPLLERVAFAFEMAAIEGLSELSRSSGRDTSLRAQATAASFRAFDIRRLLPVPADTHDRLF